MDTLLTTLAQFHLVRPFWLLMLIPAAMTGHLLWQRQTQPGSWQKIIPRELLRHLTPVKPVGASRWPLIALTFAWMIASIALAGPAWRKIPTSVEKSLTPLVLIVDLSRSMLTADIQPDRLTRMRHKLLDILKERKEGLTALVAFAGDAYTVAPLTDDNGTLANLVQALSPDIMPVPGSNPASGIRQAVDLLTQGAGEAGSLLLLTDGMSVTELAAINKVLTGTNHTLNIIGVGTAAGAPVPDAHGGFVRDHNGAIVMSRLDTSQLQTLARQHHGQYRTMSIDDDDINALLPRPGTFSKTIAVDRQFDHWHDEGFWLLLLLLPITALAFRRGWVLPAMLVAITLVKPDTSHADIWTNWWKTSDQQAMKLLQEGEAEEAAELFTNPHWQAEAWYQAENYETAARGFADWNNADGFYNQGNALARAGKLQESLAAYEKALKLSPDMADARSNAELIRKLLEQQQQQQQQEQQQEQQQRQEQQQQQEQQEQQEQQQQQKQQQPDQGDDQETSSKQNEGQENDQEQNDQDHAGASQDQSASDDNDSSHQKNSSTRQQEPGPDEQSPRQEQATRSPTHSGQQDALPQDARQPYATDQRQDNTQSRQEVENWLRRIPEDPGGLLRRKFEQQQQQRQTAPLGEQTW